MDRAARMFEGTHDFAAVRSAGTDVKSTVRTIYYCRVQRSGDLLEMKVCANGFLYNMVRAIAERSSMRPKVNCCRRTSRRFWTAVTARWPGRLCGLRGVYLTRLWYEDERLNG